MLSLKSLIKLFCIGILPLIVGFVMNYAILYLPIPGFVSILLGLLFFALWGYLSFKIADSNRNPIIQALILCVFGLLMLVLLLYQELIMGEYFANLIGFASQMFFLPFLSTISSIVVPFLNVITMSPIYVVVWIAMFIISCIGCLVKCRK